MDALDPETRVQIEGHRPGTYVRLRFRWASPLIESWLFGMMQGVLNVAHVLLPWLRGIPCEFMKHFRPEMPLLVGSVPAVEQTMGFMQMRLKRHRWFPKILKNKDPLVISAAAWSSAWTLNRWRGQEGAPGCREARVKVLETQFLGGVASRRFLELTSSGLLFSLCCCPLTAPNRHW